MLTQVSSAELTSVWGVVLFLGGLLSVILTRSHFLALLLGLEFMVLGIFVLAMETLMEIWGNGQFGLVFLVFSVCEGSLGLTILIVLVRAYGNDYLRGLSIL
uniref:NADH-ubiquinone oxidoreductase chain 4L n=1 Tax=Paratimomenus flavocapitatus TaxID=2021295 RepID=A0A678QWY6_9NEOP|nr:NADH dehydrogenase subunit 4L [Paratimomenus flavocapitatus]